MEALVSLTKHVTPPPQHTHTHKHTHLFHHISSTFSPSDILQSLLIWFHKYFVRSLINWHWIDHLKLSFIWALASEFPEYGYKVLTPDLKQQKYTGSVNQKGPFPCLFLQHLSCVSLISASLGFSVFLHKIKGID